MLVLQLYTNRVTFDIQRNQEIANSLTYPLFTCNRLIWWHIWRENCFGDLCQQKHIKVRVLIRAVGISYRMHVCTLTIDWIIKNHFSTHAMFVR